MLPKATVVKCVKRHMPQGIRCSSEAQDLALHCASEFVALVSSQATEVCTIARRAKITGDHLRTALVVSLHTLPLYIFLLLRRT